MNQEGFTEVTVKLRKSEVKEALVKYMLVEGFQVESRAMESLMIKLLMGNPILIVYVLRFMKPCLFSVMSNQNGSQLVQKLCKHVQNMYLGDLYEIPVINWDKLATMEQGCFYLKAIIESIDASQISAAINHHRPGRVPFYTRIRVLKNFVVQHVLERHPNTTNLICNNLRAHLFRISKDKYDSDVVEKCIESNATDVKSLKLSKGKALRQLVDALRKCSDDPENHQNGRNVHNLIKRRIVVVLE
ncbi:hypothetical protein C5167_030061 [Papaver somniferum]|nr:hypothetical protein C5167_030061 [Papaver somniferum]